MPSILGFLLAGIIVGPNAFNLLSSQHEVELLSEIGIIFLLFIIGIELSFKGLISIWRTVFIGGGIQVLGTIAITASVGYFFGIDWNEAVFIGFLVSLSSTAIVLKLLNDKGELKAPHGRVALGILIFQDIIVVPMMLVTPILAGNSDNVSQTVLFLLLKLIAVGIVVFVLQKYIVPKIFELVVKTKNKELFILTVIVFCFSVAWLTSSVGLSLALGAFFAGLIISESEYSHQATANVLPFREIFICFFFISVGSLLNLEFFFDNFLYICLLVIGVFVLKILVVGLSTILLGYHPKTAHLAAFSLFQVGEFSLLLSTVGLKNELLSDTVYQFFLAVSIITMALTPFLIAKSHQFTQFLLKAPVPKPIRKRLNARQKATNNTTEEVDNWEDHLVIIGYGINGKNIARVAESMDISYVIVDMDYHAIQEAKDKNQPIVFGDAAEDEILNHINIQKARVVVIAISDPNATKKIIFNIRQFSQTAYIIVRTRYVKEIQENMKLGADEVIPEEFETSIEIFTRVLKQYMVTESKILEIVKTLRSSDYEMLTSVKPMGKKPVFQHLNIPNKEVATLHVQHQNNDIVNKRISESELGRKYNITLLAIKRERKYITEIGPDTIIKVDDLIYIFGSSKDITQLNKQLKI